MSFESAGGGREPSAGENLLTHLAVKKTNRYSRNSAAQQTRHSRKFLLSGLKTMPPLVTCEEAALLIGQLSKLFPCLTATNI